MNPENQNEPTTKPETVQPQAPAYSPPPTVEPNTYFTPNNSTVTNPVAPKDNKKKLLIITVIILMLLVIGGGLYFVLRPKTPVTNTVDTTTNSATNTKTSSKTLAIVDAANKIYEGKWFMPSSSVDADTWRGFSGGSAGGSLDRSVVDPRNAANGTFLVDGLVASLTWGNTTSQLETVTPTYYDGDQLMAEWVDKDGPVELYFARDAESATSFFKAYFLTLKPGPGESRLDALYKIGALDPANNLLP